MSRGLYKSLEEVTGIDQVNIKLINFAVQEVCEIIVYRISHLKFCTQIFAKSYILNKTYSCLKANIVLIIINHFYV